VNEDAEPGLRGPNAEPGLRGPNAEPGLRGPNAEPGPGPFADDGATSPHRSRRRRWLVAGALLVVLLLAGAVGVMVRGGADHDAGLGPAPVTAPPGGTGTETPRLAPPVSDTGPDPGSTVPEAPPAPPGGPAGPTGPAAPPVAGPAPAGRAARLGRVRSWSIAIGAPVSDRSGAQVAAQFRGFDLVVLDGVDASAAAVAALRAQGSIVLAYADIGAIEEGRPWSAAAAPYRLDRWEQWNEWYADVTKPGYRALVTDTIVPPMLAKGFDGLFLDNVDMVDTHPAQRGAMIGLVAQLSATVRGRGGFLFAQNGDDATVDALLPHLDGWNREDVSFTFDDASGGYTPVGPADKQAALATLRRLKSRGVFVTTVDYVTDAGGAEARAAVQAACGAGAVPSVGDIGLTRVLPPQRC
jgi:uncharacterized protein (TIGR01370 family)